MDKKKVQTNLGRVAELVIHERPVLDDLAQIHNAEKDQRAQAGEPHHPHNRERRLAAARTKKKSTNE